MQEFTRQIKLQSNDRGAAILMGTNVDLALTSAIFHLLDTKDRDRLESDAGPLSRRILLGRALRIYGPVTQRNLDLIRHIRNAFAHAHVPITFDTKEVKAAVSLLEDVPLLHPFNVGADKELPAPEPRARFEDICGFVGHNLIVWPWHSRRVFEVPKHLIPEGHKLFLQRDPLP
jgi:hypothetical protein